MTALAGHGADDESEISSDLRETKNAHAYAVDRIERLRLGIGPDHLDQVVARHDAPHDEAEKKAGHRPAQRMPARALPDLDPIVWKQEDARGGSHTERAF